jgi:hypothetical protein
MLAFLACAVFGAVLLLAQLAAGVGGAEADAPDADTPDGDPTAGGHPGGALAALGASLAGLRPLAAGVAFFGLAGAAVRARGGSTGAALLAAVPAALAAAALTAALLRTLLRLDSDGTVRLEGAVGAEATVYVPVRGAAAGKVQLALQGRLVECSATAADGGSYPTGARVLVVDVAPEGGLLVAADPAAPAARGGPTPSRSAPS